MDNRDNRNFMWAHSDTFCSSSLPHQRQLIGDHLLRLPVPPAPCDLRPEESVREQSVEELLLTTVSRQISRTHQVPLQVHREVNKIINTRDMREIETPLSPSRPNNRVEINFERILLQNESQRYSTGRNLLEKVTSPSHPL